jgi:hypothetical protein
MRLAGHVARMGEERKMYKVLVGKPERKRPLGRPRRRWEDGIRMNLWGDWLGGVDWIRLAQYRDRWRAVVSAVMNLRVLASHSYILCLTINESHKMLNKRIDGPRTAANYAVAGNLPQCLQTCLCSVICCIIFLENTVYPFYLLLALRKMDVACCSRS